MSESITVSEILFFICRVYSYYSDICFASAYLAQETGTFSIASGIDSFDSEGITWLVEQKRPTTVIKFTGTLNHRQRQRDMRGLTVQAFAHFVYGYSKQTLVFSDLQGMK